MENEKYIKHIKKLLKIYHPDLCHDENLKDTYNEITIKLNKTLNKLENNEVKINENIPEDKILMLSVSGIIFQKSNPLEYAKITN